MNIVLIQPFVRDFYFTPIRSFPLGLCSLAACLKQQGHSVVLLDCLQGGKESHVVEGPHPFDYLNKYYRPENISPFGLYKKYRHFGLSVRRVEEQISSLRADVFGISCLFSAYADEAFQIAALVKTYHPQSQIVLGGPHATEYARDILSRQPAVDCIVHGEGEETFYRLLAEMESPDQVPGLSFRKNGHIVTTGVPASIEDLNKLPPPDRTVVNMDLYTMAGRRYTPILTSRGCPMNCDFCSNPSFMGTAFRPRSIESVCAEILSCYDELHVRIFDIEDDNLTCDKSRAKILLQRLADFRQGRPFEITAMNGLYYEFLDEELLSLLVKAGMKRLNLSLVTSSASSGKEMRRRVQFEKFENMVGCAHQQGLDILVSFILGLPHETVNAMLDTILYLSDLPVLLGPSCYYHVPGSRMFVQMETEGKVRRDQYPFFRSSAVFYENENFSREDVLTLFRLTRIINFLRSLTSEGTPALSAGKWKQAVLDRDYSAQWDIQPDRINVGNPLTPKQIGIILIKKFIKEQKLYSVLRQKDGYLFVQEKASDRILKLFAERVFQ